MNTRTVHSDEVAAFDAAMRFRVVGKAMAITAAAAIISLLAGARFPTYLFVCAAAEVAVQFALVSLNKYWRPTVVANVVELAVCLLITCPFLALVVTPGTVPQTEAVGLVATGGLITSLVLVLALPTSSAEYAAQYAAATDDK